MNREGKNIFPGQNSSQLNALQPNSAARAPTPPQPQPLQQQAQQMQQQQQQHQQLQSQQQQQQQQNSSVYSNKPEPLLQLVNRLGIPIRSKQYLDEHVFFSSFLGRGRFSDVFSARRDNSDTRMSAIKKVKVCLNRGL